MALDLASPPSSSGLTTPCPPYYAPPSHEQTLVFETSSYVRNSHVDDGSSHGSHSESNNGGGDGWYQCVQDAYCNTPSFLGYNPPGVGYRWSEAWTRLDEGYPCNPTLALSTTGVSWGGGAGGAADGGDGGEGNVDGAAGAATRTSKPTGRPTRAADLPSLISGAVWYDANYDGRRNTVANAASGSDREAASKERGAGVANMKVTLRECGSDELLGVTYTFPRSFGLGTGSSGEVDVVDSTYIDSVQDLEAESAGYGGVSGASGLLGLGNDDMELGYYSFRVLANQLPGKFYVVFESPEGYALSGGSGEYWEVYESAEYDLVQPVLEANWLVERDDEDRRVRHLQDGGDGDDGDDDLHPSQKPRGPVNHSGYYARSSCLSIEQSPMRISDINAGLAREPWPMSPYQYASLVATIKFYAFDFRRGRGTRRRRRRRGQQALVVDSLECRRYQKLKSEGAVVSDLWGCETAAKDGPDVDLIGFEELTLEEADLVTDVLMEFLGSRLSRAWTVKLVSVAHQEMNVLDSSGESEEGAGGEEDGGGDSDSDSNRLRRRRRELRSDADSPASAADRSLQANQNIADLTLGLRIRGEYRNTPRGTLQEAVMSAIRVGEDDLLSMLKTTILNDYFIYAGGIVVRDVLWQPDPRAEDNKVVDYASAAENPEGQENDERGGGMSAGAIAGAVIGSLAFVGIIVGLLVYRRRKAKAAADDGSGSHPSQQEDAKVDGRKRKWWQRKSAGMDGKQTDKNQVEMRREAALRKRASKKRLNASGFSSSPEDEGEWDSDDDDLSSRFYSDSSKFDPATRMAEVGSLAYDDDDDLSSRFYSDSSKFDPAARMAEVGSLADHDNDDLSSRFYSDSSASGSQRSFATESADGGASYASSSRSVRSSATSSSQSRSLRSSGTSARSMRSGDSSRGGSSRRTSQSSTRSSGNHRKSGASIAADLYGQSGERRWSASLRSDERSQSTGDSGDRNRAGRR